MLTTTRAAPWGVSAICAPPPNFLGNKAEWLRKLADVIERQGDPASACVHLREAESSLQRGLAISPRHPDLLAEFERVRGLLADWCSAVADGPDAGSG